MQLAYELLPVWAGQDDKPPTAISNLRRSHLYLTRHTSFVVRRTSCVARQFNPNEAAGFGVLVREPFRTGMSDPHGQRGKVR